MTATTTSAATASPRPPINAPIAASALYLAHRAHETDDGAHAPLYTAVAGISGALAVHGIATIAHPYHAPALDLLGTDLAPAIVDDGRELGPGVATTGTF